MIVRIQAPPQSALLKTQYNHDCYQGHGYNDSEQGSTAALTELEKGTHLHSYTFYCMSKKSRLIIYSTLIYKMGQDFLDIQYTKDYTIADLKLKIVLTVT